MQKKMRHEKETLYDTRSEPYRMNEPIYERMQQLIQQIRQADTAYYKHDAPIMSDLEYDRLIDDLVALEEDSGVILSNSPTQHVAGETLETLAEVRHTKPMLSAAKTKSVDDLIRFAAGQDVLLSWKMDGLTLVLRYENGHLSQAITRGRDGIIGEDVTHTVKTFLNVPLTIPISEAFEVRGEGVISWKNFNTINADLDDAYSHPRNLAAGSESWTLRKRRSGCWNFGHSIWSATAWNPAASTRSSSFWRAAASAWFHICICLFHAAPVILNVRFSACSRPGLPIPLTALSWNMTTLRMAGALALPGTMKIA